jgi:hypothetical protein
MSSKRSVSVEDKLQAHWDALLVLIEQIEKDAGHTHPAIQLLLEARRRIDDAMCSFIYNPLEI